MTTITEGISPADFIAAINGNVTELGFTGKTVSITDKMLGWRLQSSLKLCGASGLSHGVSGASYISALNAISVSSTIATDVKTFGATGDGVTDDTVAIQTAINAGNCIIQDGTFLISASIKIPSNRIVYLKNCVLKMANTSYDNFFRNSDMINGNTNIKIIGLGGAELDGNAPNNNDAYATYGPLNHLQTPPLNNTTYRYIGIILCNVDVFEITGLYAYDYPHWLCYLQKCTNGSVHDIYFDHHTTVANQDAFPIGHGSHDIDIYNIQGTCADDFGGIFDSAYSGLAYTGIANWNVGDVYNINYYDIDITDSSQGAIAAYLSGDGNKIHDIDYKRIRLRAGGSILYTNYTAWRTVANTKNDLYNLTFDDIQFDVLNIGFTTYANTLGYDMKNCTMTNIVNRSGYGMYTLIAGDQSDNVTINGVQVV